MSKAFDYVNYWKLLARLIDVGVEKHMIRLLVFLYVNEEIFVCWNNIHFETFGRANELRQGSIAIFVHFSY